MSECSRLAISPSKKTRQVPFDRSRQDSVSVDRHHRICSILKSDHCLQGPMCPSLPVSPLYSCLATCCSGEQPPRGSWRSNNPSPWTTSWPGFGYLSSTEVLGVSHPFPSSATNMRGRSLKATSSLTGALAEEPYAEVEVETLNVVALTEDNGLRTELGSETMLTLRKNVSLGNITRSVHNLPRHNSY